MDNVAICHPGIKEGCHESTHLNIKGYNSQLETHKYDKKKYKTWSLWYSLKIMGITANCKYSDIIVFANIYVKLLSTLNIKRIRAFLQSTKAFLWRPFSKYK